MADAPSPEPNDEEEQKAGDDSKSSLDQFDESIDAQITGGRGEEEDDET